MTCLFYFIMFLALGVILRRAVRPGRFLALASMALLIGMAMGRPAIAGVTWLPNGAGAGSYPNGGTDTRVRLTGTAQTYVDVPLASFLAGDGATPLTTTAASAVPYLTGYLGSNFAFPAASNFVSATAQVTIPQNYESGGVMQVLVGYNTADTAARLTANVTFNLGDGSTATSTIYAGDSTYPGALAGKMAWVSLPNTALTYVPDGVATFQLIKNAGTTAVVRVYKARFKYKPWSVIP